MAKVQVHGTVLCGSARAGGYYMLEVIGALQLMHDQLPLTDRQRANLSYWIYRHNHPYWLFGKSTEQGVVPPVVDEKWVQRNLNRTPSTSDRLLTFLCELIHRFDTRTQRWNLQLERDLHMAAGGCRTPNDLGELYQHAIEQSWVKMEPGGGHGSYVAFINLPARIHVEEQLRKRGKDENGFVAMWFADCMNEVYKDGIKPAIDDAGYKPVRIDRQEFLGNVPDEILAEIRQSRFVVADFTACKKCAVCETCKKIGAPGGVYYEAGFARGLGMPVIHTVHEDCMDDVHFDTSSINHITWDTSEDLREKLQRRIEATLGRGPVDSSADRNGRAGGAFIEDA